MSERLTIPHLALASAHRWPTAEAVVDGARRLSFADLAAQMEEAAAAFVAAGLQPGDRVGLWLPNGLDWIVACLGLHAAGGILVPLNTRYKAEEARYILARAGVRMVVAADDFLGVRYGELTAGLGVPSLERVVTAGVGGNWPDFISAAGVPARAEVRNRIDALTEDSVSDIMFTSGTTGNPKGAVTTHGQTIRTAQQWGRATTLAAGDRFLILWPLFHTSGYKGAWIPSLSVGATVLPMATLDMPLLLDIVERERVTFLPGPPPLFQTLLAMPDRKPGMLESLRVSVTGGTSVAPSMIEAMRRELGIPIVLTGYGLTETCGTATMTGPGDPPEIVAVSCGRAIEGVELACVDDDNRPVPVGQPGEVVIRGMNVMRGYLDDPEATAQAIDADGWLHSGDIGVLDAAGYLRITDRKKDMFIVGGYNCYPAEIEKMLLAHPAILQVAVAGVPDERMGEVGKAYVVRKQDHVLEAEELIAWSRERMANFKVPRHVAFVPELPTNATGKVQKFRLAEL
ncbi:FadD3 family acyl-CoA ligase [Sphingosinicella sp. LHD-64]|uniref:FadD3 family acyl-CoA ligase n=1 Tax=Sphingosinicella sp. LHD-64 TaxID=3072139 RepID=UPI00280D70B6|nr:FadD3 family acyl-CoA ligase [Sphingosinicella sp. LHD-64]MDQ8757595.1 FadD3 family acyl-CoA ligase [Sphingosinicella sp. LHD-64]